MREIRQSGSEGGVALTTPSLPLSMRRGRRGDAPVCRRRNPDASATPPCPCTANQANPLTLRRCSAQCREVGLAIGYRLSAIPHPASSVAALPRWEMSGFARSERLSRQDPGAPAIIAAHPAAGWPVAPAPPSSAQLAPEPA